MKNKWTFISSLLAVVLLALTVGSGQAQEPGPQGDAGVQTTILGTAFTYQGQLKQGGNPVNGNCDFQFSLWDAGSGGTQVGTTQTKTNVSVSNGLFTTSLDFGSVFTGDARWLQIAVCCPAGSGRYTNLSPRQALTAAPYALALRPGARIQGSVGLGSVVMGDNTSTNLLGMGVMGTSAGGIGVYGKATASSGTTSGVYGESNSPEGRGVSGYANATSGATYGVYGESDSPAGAGVYGRNGATGGYAYGVRGDSASTDGIGVFGKATASSGDNIGVYGESTSTGVYANAPWRGVYGHATSSYGLGVLGYASATSGFTYGVYGKNDSTSGTGVCGSATAPSYTAVGVYGAAIPPGKAGYFSGDVGVTGNFSAGGSKSFKIDHPLDPAGRYLYHFAQEGPEVQNVYNGVVTLDAQGEAVVTLPTYFEALNTGPFRYQLTAIGAPMPNLYIAQEIQGSTFRIAGGAPGKKVSWEVTAIRNDPNLRDHPVQVEVDKPADEQGTYLYPEGYDQPREMGLDYQRNRDLLERHETEPLPASGER